MTTMLQYECPVTVSSICTQWANPEIILRENRSLILGLFREQAKQRLQRGPQIFRVTEVVNECFFRFLGENLLNPTDQQTYKVFVSKLMRQALTNLLRSEAHDTARIILSHNETLGDKKHLDTATFSTTEWALSMLDSVRPRLGTMMELHFFGCMSQEEIANHLELPERKVRHQMNEAVAWLLHEIACLKAIKKTIE